MFGSRHDIFVYSQGRRQTVMSLTPALRVKKSSEGDGVCREGTSTEEARETRSESQKKCVSEQQRGLCSRPAERDTVLGRLHPAAKNAKLH